MQKYNFSANVVRTIEQLYYEASSAVQMNGSMKERLKKKVRIRQGCFLSPLPSTFFSDGSCLMLWKKYYGKVSMGDRNITNLRFADDIDALAEEE